MNLPQDQAAGPKRRKAGPPLMPHVDLPTLSGYLLPVGARAMRHPVSTTIALPAHERKALERLKKVDPDMLAPREALDILYELRDVLQARHHLMRE